MKFLKLSFVLAVGLAFAAISTQAQTPIPLTFALSASYHNNSSEGAVVTINNAYILSKVFGALGFPVPAGASLAINTNGNVVVLVNKAIIMDLSYGTNLTTTTITTITTKKFLHNVTLSYTNTTYRYAYIPPFYFYDAIWTGTETSTSLFSLTGKAIAGSYPYYYDSVSKVAPKGYGYYGDYMEFYSETTTTTYTGTTTSAGPNTEEYYYLCNGAKATIGVSLNSSGLYTLNFVAYPMGDCYTSVNGQDGYETGMISANGTQQGGESFLDPFNGYGNYYVDYYDAGYYY
jgi:hypothetical protein